MKPKPPILGPALRTAAVDFYFASWRLVPANLAWGALLLVLLAVAFRSLPGALFLAVALAIPTTGIYRMTALIARGEAVRLRDALEAYGRFALPATALGLAGVLGTTVLTVNMVSGITVIGGPIGWAIATAAAWGLAFLWSWLLCAWPLVTDPARDGQPVAGRLRLAALLVLAHPLRVGGLLIITLVLLILSTVLFAALVTISVAYCALVGCRSVLPSADRLEGRATVSVPVVD